MKIPKKIRGLILLPFVYTYLVIMFVFFGDPQEKREIANEV